MMRRLFRFRLRTLMIAMAIFGGLGGCLTAFQSAHYQELSRMEEVFDLLESPFQRSSYESEGVLVIRKIPDNNPMKVG